MSYRHIKGLTLRYNDIRASDGGAYENMRQPYSFNSSVGTFVSAVKLQSNTKASG